MPRSVPHFSGMRAEARVIEGSQTGILVPPSTCLRGEAELLFVNDSKVRQPIHDELHGDCRQQQPHKPH